MSDSYLGQYEYRDIKIDLFNDDNGQQIYAHVLPNKYFKEFEVGLGAFNFNYKEDLEFLINMQLDTLYAYDDKYFGARIEWFDNSGYRDIQLRYRQRILKIWPVDGIAPDVTRLITEGLAILAEIVGE